VEFPFVNPVRSRLRPDTTTALLSIGLGVMVNRPSLLASQDHLGTGIACERELEESRCIIRQPHIIYMMEMIRPVASGTRLTVWMCTSGYAQRSFIRHSMSFVHDYGAQVCHQKPSSGFYEGLISAASPHRWLQSLQVVCTTTR
jgi:hypothetical protein